MSRTRPGFLRFAYDALIDARTKQASRYVSASLLMLDDETLKQHGYSRQQLLASNPSRYII